MTHIKRASQVNMNTSQQATPTSLRYFLTIWFGQLVSGIGSSMTSIAIEIWAWEITGKATTLALVGFFSLLPGIIITPISGIVVDRFNRKLIMMMGDTVAVLTTVILLLLLSKMKTRCFRIKGCNSPSPTYPIREINKINSQKFYSWYTKQC